VGEGLRAAGRLGDADPLTLGDAETGLEELELLVVGDADMGLFVGEVEGEPEAETGL
jgi:hypothetical protein